MKLNHLAIILDGNRRWAKERDLPSIEGHRQGYERLKDVGQWVLDRDIEHLTVFAFSTENWKRSEEEVGYLMDLFYQALTDEVDMYMERDVRVRIIGRREGLSEKILRAIEETETRTAGNKKGQLNLCINYGGRPEIIAGIKKLIDQGVKAEEVTEEMLANNIWMTGIPDPDLIIRTSGEQRLSGFLTWSGVYSELYFVPEHWPDFSEAILDQAISTFENRERRFGGNPDQAKNDLSTQNNRK